MIPARDPVAFALGTELDRRALGGIVLSVEPVEIDPEFDARREREATIAIERARRKRYGKPRWFRGNGALGAR